MAGSCGMLPANINHGNHWPCLCRNWACAAGVPDHLHQSSSWAHACMHGRQLVVNRLQGLHSNRLLRFPPTICVANLQHGPSRSPKVYVLYRSRFHSFRFFIRSEKQPITSLHVKRVSSLKVFQQQGTCAGQDATACMACLCTSVSSCRRCTWRTWSVWRRRCTFSWAYAATTRAKSSKTSMCRVRRSLAAVACYFAIPHAQIRGLLFLDLLSVAYFNSMIPDKARQ